MPVKQKPISPEFFNFDESILRILSYEYDLPDIDSFCPLLLDGDLASLLEVRSETSRKMIIETSTDRFFLKQIPWYCDDEEHIKFSHLFQRMLFEKGAPVAQIIPTISGQTWVSIQGMKFTLFKYIKGQRYNASREQLVAAAKALAQIHNYQLVIEGLVPEDFFKLVENHIDLATDSLVDHAESKGERDTLLSVLRSELTRARQHCLEEAWEQLPLTAIQGDYNPWNLIFDDSGEVRAVLDFDNSDIGPRLHDVAEAIVTFCSMNYRGDSTNFASDAPNELSKEKTDLFLTNYHSVSPLSRSELTCLPWVMRATFIELSCLGLIRGDFKISQGESIINWLSQGIEIGIPLE